MESKLGQRKKGSMSYADNGTNTKSIRTERSREDEEFTFILPFTPKEADSPGHADIYMLKKVQIKSRLIDN